MSTRIAAIAVGSICLLSAGCLWEPYPSFSYRRITMDQLPPPARRAFLESYPGTTIQAVEQRDFKGKTVDYSIQFSASGSRTGVIRLTPQGKESGVPEIRRAPSPGEKGE